MLRTAIVFWAPPADLPFLPDAIASVLRKNGVPVAGTADAGENGAVPPDPASAQAAACRRAASMGAERVILVRAWQEVAPTLSPDDPGPKQLDPGIDRMPPVGPIPSPAPAMHPDGFNAAMRVPMRLFDVAGCTAIGEESFAMGEAHAPDREAALETARQDLLRDLERVLEMKSFTAPDGGTRR